MLSRSTQLPDLEDAEAQYRAIRNYFDAVKKWEPKAWSKPKEYIILRGSGLWAICFICAQVIDRVMMQGEYKSANMLSVLKIRERMGLDKRGDFKGLGGRGGAL